MVDIRGAEQAPTEEQDQPIVVRFIYDVHTAWEFDDDGDEDKETTVEKAREGLEELIAHEGMGATGYVVCDDTASAMGETYPCEKEWGHLGEHGGFYD